jgi:spore germination protein KA
MSIGQQTKTKVGIVYIEGIVDKRIVNEVKRRLSNIKIDGVLESGTIEGMIRDAPLSPVPTVANSEKPDKVAAKLLEGRLLSSQMVPPLCLLYPVYSLKLSKPARIITLCPFLPPL